MYLCSTPWASSKELLEDYMLQTPKLDGIWNDIEGSDEISGSDYAVVFDSDPFSESIAFPPGKKIYMSREALDAKSIKGFPQSEFIHFSFWNGTGYNPVKWAYPNSPVAGTGYSGLGLNYQEVLELRPSPKKKLIASTLSAKKMTRGHRLRLRFAKKFMKALPELDVFGQAPFANKALIDNSKAKTLSDYAFQLTFDNQCHLQDFIGTQFTDSLLLWSKPLFWGSKDVFKYYPPGSFTWFDVEKPKLEIPRLIEIITHENYADSLPFIAEAREKILNTYNFWPTLQKIIDARRD